MNNPFKKETNTGLIAVIVIGSVIAAGLAYLFFTEDGEELLEGLKYRLKERIKDIASTVLSEETGISKQTVRKAADVAAK